MTDLAVTSIYDDYVSILINNGPWTYEFPTNQLLAEFQVHQLPVGSAPFFVAIADLNGDDIADLSVANHDSDDISVLLGNGDGTFQPEQRFAVGDDPRSIAIADLNNDSRPDLAVANYGADYVSVLINHAPSLCSDESKPWHVLTDNFPDTTVTSNQEILIYGTNTSNSVTIESGAKVELINFPGNNEITIEADSKNFTVFRSGAVLKLNGGDGTILKLPATTDTQILIFNDTSLDCLIQDGQILLGDQVVSTTPEPIDVEPT